MANAQEVSGNSSILAALGTELRAIADAVSPSVVTVRSIPKNSGSNGPNDPSGRAMSVGSGIILDSAGTILTTVRVVHGSDDFWVETWDGRMYRATLLGIDRDIAVLQIDAEGLQPARMGEAADLGVGSVVLTIGNSYGFSGAMAWGMINGFRPDGTMQLTLGVSAGNSGGALVDTEGRVVGVVKAKISEPFYLNPLFVPGQDDQPPLVIPGRRLELPTSQISLAIPVDVAMRSVARITRSDHVAHAYVGVYVEDLTGWHIAHFKTAHGVLVTGVVDQTPAARYGLLFGDVITAIDREVIRTVQQFRAKVAYAHPGQRLMLDIIRGGQGMKLVVEAGRADVSQMYRRAGPTGNGPNTTRSLAADNVSSLAQPATMRSVTPSVGPLANPGMDSIATDSL